MKRETREITLVIDGREIAATEGAMLVDAARHGDVEIPVFCYEPKLGQPVGACRMCLVEIEGIPKLQTACSTPVRDGMVVYTQTDQVKEAQNAVVEFLLVNHPLDCPVCDKGGECPLQDISIGWGPGNSRFIEGKRHFEKPLPLSPLVAIDRERCIMCYRCVRFSQEISEDAQLQLLERGDRTYVGTFDERPYIAPFHGNITELCPVGALTSYTYRFRARPWDIEQAGSVCTLCPSQCNVRFTIRDEKVKRVLARDNPEVDDGWLCDRGRYGFEMFGADERITAPMIREGDGFRVASWPEAIERAASGLRTAGSETAALVGDASNEEGYLVQRIIREALGGGDIDSRPGGGADRNLNMRLSDPAISARVADIDTADVVLVLGVDPIHSAPILDLRVRKAVRRSGTLLAIATDRPSALDGGATAVARSHPRHTAAMIEEIRNGTGDGAEIAALLEDAEDIVVIWGERVAREGRAVESLLGLAADLKLSEGERSGLIGVPELANGRGLREVGCLPDAAPGLGETGKGPGRDTGAIREALIADQLKALILFGSDPLRDAPDSSGWEEALTQVGFTVAFSMFGDASTARADVVFPLETFAEKEGTVTHMEGRLQRVRPSAKRPGDVRPGWQILAEISASLGDETGISSAPDALLAVADSVSFYAGLTAEEIGGRGIRWQDRTAAESLPASTGVGVTDGHSEHPKSTPAPDPGGALRLGTFRDLWANEVTELNPALRFLTQQQRLEIAPVDAERLGISQGEEVEVGQNGNSVKARVVLRERQLPGVVFLIEGTLEGNANELVHGPARTVEIRKAEGH